MNGENNRIDDLFREGMEGHFEMPSDIVWESIELALDKKDRRNPFIVFFSTYKKIITISIVGLIGISLIGYYIYQHAFSHGPILEIAPQKAKTENDPQSNHSPLLKNATSEPLTSDQRLSSTNNIQSKKTSPADHNVHPQHLSIQDVTPEKEKAEKKSSLSQPKIIVRHHINDTPIKNTKNVRSTSKTEQAEYSKDKLVKKSPPNEAVANLSYVSQSVPFKNKTDVAGSLSIRKSIDEIDNNASAIQVIKEQTKLALIATIQRNHHDLTPIVETLVSLNTKPSIAKTLTNVSATATDVNLINGQQTETQNKQSTRFRFSLTPVLLNQNGKFKIIDETNIPIITFPPPPVPPPTPTTTPRIVSRIKAGTYKMNTGLLTNFYLTKKLSVQTGATLSSLFFKSNGTFALAVDRPDGSIKFNVDYGIGSVYLDPKTASSPQAGDIEFFDNIKTNLVYVQIPLLFNWHMGNGKLKGFVTLGGNYTKLVGLYVSTDIQQLRIKQKVNDQAVTLRFNYFNAVGGAGIEWNFKKRLTWVLSSQYQQSLTPYLKNRFVRSYPYNLTTQMRLQIGLF